MTYEQVQLMRYTELGGKGGDGDPAYARDASMLLPGKRLGTMTEDGRYRRQGD